MEIEGEMVLMINGKKYIDSNGIVLNEVKFPYIYILCINNFKYRHYHFVII